MSYKLLSYILDEEVVVINPKFVVSIYSGDLLVEQYGSFMLIRDDLLKATLYALHINEKPKDQCRVFVHKDDDKILELKLINLDTGMEKLKSV